MNYYIEEPIKQVLYKQGDCCYRHLHQETRLLGHMADALVVTSEVWAHPPEPP